jgi:hypothetical protein
MPATRGRDEEKGDRGRLLNRHKKANFLPILLFEHPIKRLIYLV